MLSSWLLPHAVRRGGPGWPRLANRIARGSLGLVGVAFVVGGLVAIITGSGPGRGGGLLLGLLGTGLLALAIPARPGRSRPRSDSVDGEPLTVIGLRPAPIRIFVTLVVAGAILMAGCAAAVAIAVRAGETAGLLPAGGYFAAGVLLGGLGVVGMLPRFRRLPPVLVTAQRIGWMWAGERRWARWREIGGVEAWWTPVPARGRNRFPPVRAHQILLRDLGGEPVLALPVERLVDDPEQVLAVLERARDAAQR